MLHYRMPARQRLLPSTRMLGPDASPLMATTSTQAAPSQVYTGLCTMLRCWLHDLWHTCNAKHSHLQSSGCMGPVTLLETGWYHESLPQVGQGTRATRCWSGCTRWLQHRQSWKATKTCCRRPTPSSKPWPSLPSNTKSKGLTLLHLSFF